MVSNSVNLLITPSGKTIKATFTEIVVSSEIIKKDIGSLLVTLKDVNEIFEVVTNSSNLNLQLRSLNPISWSIPATAKLVIDVATKYLTQRTGFSFTDWTNFFSSVLMKFSNYVDGLDKLPEILNKYDDSIPDGDITEVKKDEAYVLQIKSETQAWRSYIEQIAKLSLALDTIMDAQQETEIQISQNSKPFGNVTDDIQKMWGALTDKSDKITSDKASEIQKRLIKWFFSSISGVKGKTKEFTKQTKELSPKLSELENLLELEIAQLQAYASKIKKEEAAILGARVSATVIIPQLKNRIDKCKKEILDYNNYLEKLNLELEKQSISEQVYEILANEYKEALETAGNLLSKSLAEAEIWKGEGVVLLENAIRSANKELEIVRARKLSGQIMDMDEVKKKSKSLNNEIRRLEKARELIGLL
ncbi:MAG TPA: hypothetical protein PKK96_14895 [Anaerolineales bacterium]|nr:hypothetical protein [Anaerolineales bacterium]HNS62287.1 hypothetical protein [Anaerolineales bacterium]